MPDLRSGNLELSISSNSKPDSIAIKIQEIAAKDEEEIAVDTELKHEYQRLLEIPQPTNNEIKSPNREQTYRTIQVIMQRERDTRRELARQSSSQRSAKKDFTADLRLKQERINECLFLLKTGIRKRKLPIYLITSSMMIGIGLYLLNTWLYTDPHTRQELYPELYTQLENQLSELSASYPSLVEGSQKAFYYITNASFNISTKDNKYVMPCIYRVLDSFRSDDSCIDRLEYDWSCALKMQSLSHYCADNIHAWAGKPVDFDPCPPLINEWCSTYAAMTRNINFNQSTSYNLEHFNQYAKHYVDENLYGWLHNELTFYAILLTFGEFAPLVILCITFLTHMFTNIFSSPRLCFNLTEEEQATISATATEYDIPNNPNSYPLSLQIFKNHLQVVTHNIEQLQQIGETFENSRHAFCMGEKSDAKSAPVSLLFKDRLAELKLIPTIFEMAGIDVEAQQEELTRQNEELRLRL